MNEKTMSHEILKAKYEIYKARNDFRIQVLDFIEECEESELLFREAELLFKKRPTYNKTHNIYGQEGKKKQLRKIFPDATDEQIDKMIKDINENIRWQK